MKNNEIKNVAKMSHSSDFLPNAIVLTGGIASGKSTCAKLLKSWGFSVVCADSIAHSVLENNADILIKEFGKEIVLDCALIKSSAKSSLDSSADFTTTPRINRKMLGQIVFANEKKRKLLESITHPQIHANIYKEAQNLEKKLAQHSPHKTYYFLDIPLFFESGGKVRYNARFSLSIVTSPALQLERILKRDGLSLKQAQERIDAQMPSAEKIKKSDFVLFNNTTLEELESSLKDFITMLELCENNNLKS